MAERRTTSLAISWNNLGASLLDQHEKTEAIAAYEKAVAIRSSAVPAALRALAVLYQERGDFDRAQGALLRLVVIRPDSRSARDALSRMYREMLRLGLHERAIAGMQRAVRETPYDEGLHYVLGETMQRFATPAAMIEFFAAESARDPKPQTSHYFWAIGLARSGDMTGAIAQLQRALEIDPAHELSQRQWGLWLEQRGELDSALLHLEEATQIHPEFRAALEDAARVAQQLGKTNEADAFRARAASADPNTRRRFVYWARYLHAHGRDRAAQAEVQRMLAEVPNDRDALALRDVLAASVGAASSGASAHASSETKPPWRLTAMTRAAIVARLRAQPADSSTWITYDARDAAARALATDLAASFEEAHWRVRSVTAASIPLKPGVLLLAAPAEPSVACHAVRQAIEASGLPLTFGSGYRDFSAERLRSNPTYQALPLDPDQDFILVIGRQP
jgi:tetratricopeptide (TPR) repeat protein